MLRELRLISDLVVYKLVLRLLERNSKRNKRASMTFMLSIACVVFIGVVARTELDTIRLQAIKNRVGNFE